MKNRRHGLLAHLRFGSHVSRLTFAFIFVTLVLTLAGCSSLPIIGGGPPTPSRQISFDGPVTLTVHAGTTLVGTTIQYQGKASDGRAIMSIDGLQALKATADSVHWMGALVLFSLVDLNLRVVTYDASSMTLAGTIHIVVQDPQPTTVTPSTKPIASFAVPLTYTVDVNTEIPGTTVTYLGAKTDGAQFANLDQFPYRQRFDSVVWQGHLRDRIAIHYDLRVADFNADRVILGGTANVIFEP